MSRGAYTFYSKYCITQVSSKQKARDGPPHQFVLCNNVLQYVDAF